MKTFIKLSLSLIILLVMLYPASASSQLGWGQVSLTNKTAPDFELETLEGKKAKLSDYRGKKVILNFWASWCPPCREEMPEFQRIYSENKDKLVVVGVNLQENRENAEAFIEKLGIAFPILLDPNSQVKDMYNVFTQPVTYFIDESGKIVDKKFGPLTSEEIDEKIAKMNVKNSPSASLESEEIKTLPDGTKYIIHPSKFLSGGPGKDGIPSIDNPEFILADKVDWLSEEELGLGIVYKGESRFYPFRILVYHEIVNDFIQNDPILVTYCPLCFTGIGFIREIDNEPVEFGVSGKLYNSELVMYDRKTDSYWPQTLGKAVLGPSIGKTIKKIIKLFIILFEDLQHRTGVNRAHFRMPFQTCVVISYQSNAAKTHFHFACQHCFRILRHINDFPTMRRKPTGFGLS